MTEQNQSVQRIAMWSGPRNISTAMMRAFENRPDCAVVDEPFYAAYLEATGIDHPGRDEVLASQPRDWRTVARHLTEDCPGSVYYQKHMTQHILPEMDMGFVEQFSNCFLIREPRRIIASYARIRPEFSLEELGFTQQRDLFQRECERLGNAPPVLDASLTLEDPSGVLSRLCEQLQIPFYEQMLTWPAGPRDSDGVWAPHWYSSVWTSTGFRKPDASPATADGSADGGGGNGDEAGTGLTVVQERLCQEAEAIYAEMKSFALRS